MQTSHEVLGLYLHLARASEQRQRWLVRDKMLVLAGVTAAEMELPTVAAFCRAKILQHNTGHVVGHFNTLEDALEDEDFHVYLVRLRSRYPRERAEHILGTLGISQANERDSYYTDYEYAAALMGTTPEYLDRMFSHQPQREDFSNSEVEVLDLPHPRWVGHPPESNSLADEMPEETKLQDTTTMSAGRWAMVVALLIAVALLIVAIVASTTLN